MLSTVDISNIYTYFVKLSIRITLWRMKFFLLLKIKNWIKNNFFSRFVQFHSLKWDFTPKAREYHDNLKFFELGIFWCFQCFQCLSISFSNENEANCDMKRWSTRTTKIAELTDYENSFWRTIENGYIGYRKCKLCERGRYLHRVSDVSTSRFIVALSHRKILYSMPTT